MADIRTFLNSLSEDMGEPEYKTVYYYSTNYPDTAESLRARLTDLGKIDEFENWKADHIRQRDAVLKEASRNYNRDCQKNLKATQSNTIRTTLTTSGTSDTDKEQNKRLESNSVKYNESNLDRFHIINDKGQLGGTLDDVVADDVIESQPMLNYEGRLYLYNGGWYEPDNINKTKVKELISKRLYLKYRKYQIIAQIHNHILTKQQITRSENELNLYPAHFINLQNGMLDGDTLNLSPHDPKYYALNQIPHPWVDKEPDKDSITVQYLSDLIGDPDDLEMFLQFCGYCMTRDTSQQVFMIIHGNGGTGKSVLLRLVAKAIGSRNICNIPLQAINSERFASAFLFGKLVNIYADLPSRDMTEVDVLKTITGEDSVRAEIKGGAVFSFHPYCKLLFSANKIPKSRDDKTDAYYRRMRILTINKRAVEIPNLEKRLEDDIQSFIWLCVQALHRMYKSGKMIESGNSELETAQLYADTDSVQAFLNDYGYTITGELKDRVGRTELYKEYEQYCVDEGRSQNAYSPTGFYSNLRDKGCIIKDNIRLAGGNNNRAIAGITKEQIPEDIPFT